MNSPCCFFPHAILTIPAAAFLNCTLVKHRKLFLVSADSDWIVRIERSPTVWQPYYPTPVSTGSNIQPADEAGPTAGLTTLSVLLRFTCHSTPPAYGIGDPYSGHSFRRSKELTVYAVSGAVVCPTTVVSNHSLSLRPIQHHRLLLYNCTESGFRPQAQARSNPSNFETAQSPIEG